MDEDFTAEHYADAVRIAEAMQHQKIEDDPVTVAAMNWIVNRFLKGP